VAKVTMPQLGESVAEGTIGKWLKQPGDHVDKYEPLLEVITHLERSPVDDLACQRAGRAEHEIDARALLLFEPLRDLGEGEAEIRSGRDRRRPLRPDGGCQDDGYEE
jgi:hypothetical protein